MSPALPAIDPSDPHRDQVYSAEAAALPDGGRRFGRFAQLTEWVDDVVIDSWWSATFPDAPIEVVVERRSRGATFSCATVAPDRSIGLLLIRDGSWDSVTVIHELAHMATLTPGEIAGVPAHGPDFVDALVALWRRHLGAHAYGALCSALDDRDVPRHRERRPGVSSV